MSAATCSEPLHCPCSCPPPKNYEVIRIERAAKTLHATGFSENEQMMNILRCNSYPFIILAVGYHAISDQLLGSDCYRRPLMRQNGRVNAPSTGCWAMNTSDSDKKPKGSARRRSCFPGKECGSVSFNLTTIGRQLLKEQSTNAGVSYGDYVEMLVRERAGMPPLRLPPAAKQTGPKGGAKSFFFGKDRGTTTAVCVTPTAHRLLDEQVAASRMSRGDYIEYILRRKASLNEQQIYPSFAPPSTETAKQGTDPTTEETFTTNQQTGVTPNP